jgi:hypothetical protein
MPLGVDKGKFLVTPAWNIPPLAHAISQGSHGFAEKGGTATIEEHAMGIAMHPSNGACGQRML